MTLVWTAVADDAPQAQLLAAGRRAVKDARSVAFLDAGTGRHALDLVALLNTAGVPVVNVGDPGLAPALCGRDPFPSGRRTAVAPQGADPAARATAATEAIFDALAPLPVRFDRRPVIDALLARFADCPPG